MSSELQRISVPGGTTSYSFPIAIDDGTFPCWPMVHQYLVDHVDALFDVMRHYGVNALSTVSMHTNFYFVGDLPRSCTTVTKVEVGTTRITRTVTNDTSKFAMSDGSIPPNIVVDYYFAAIAWAQSFINLKQEEERWTGVIQLRKPMTALGAVGQNATRRVTWSCPRDASSARLIGPQGLMP